MLIVKKTSRETVFEKPMFFQHSNQVIMSRSPPKDE